MRKAIFSLSLIMVTLVVCACGKAKLSGSYESAELYGAKTVYTFDGDEVSKTYTATVGDFTKRGKFRISKEGDGEYIFFNWNDEDTEEEDEPNGNVGWDFKLGDNYIEIAGTRYQKIRS